MTIIGQDLGVHIFDGLARPLKDLQEPIPREPQAARNLEQLVFNACREHDIVDDDLIRYALCTTAHVNHFMEIGQCNVP